MIEKDRIRGGRLGIYGGTFAPPHLAHVSVARDFLLQAELDRLLVIPTAIPPHKQLDVDDNPEIRLEMARAAFESMDPRIAVSDYEIRKSGISYTCETLLYFHMQTGAELFFLCGTDMFLTLSTWRNPEIIFSLATVACVMRENHADAYEKVRAADQLYKEKYGARTMMIRSTPREISSTEIRRRIRAGESISGLVTPEVEKIIARYGLYRK